MKSISQITSDVCFACTTPYQIIGAISIVVNYNLNADLYIFGMFPNYNNVAYKLSKYDIFMNVHAVDCTYVGSPGRIKGFFEMLFAKKTVSYFLPKEANYDYYFSSSRAFIKTVMQHVLLQRNPQMHRVIYEDGMGTYARNSHPLQVTKLKLFAEKILGWNLDRPENTSMMAYMPELVEVPEGLHCEVDQMPRLKWNKSNKEMLKDVFSLKADAAIKNKYIIFDILRNSQSYSERRRNILLDNSYQRIMSVVGEKEIICKPHPRSLYGSSVGMKQYPYQEIPMEILYANMEDLEEKVLITYISSAVFTPKILFDKEPYVICLHNMIEQSETSFLFQKIYTKFKRVYRNKSKVMAPSTLNELELVLKRISNMYVK